MITGIFTRAKKKIGDVFVDAFIRESYTKQVKVTEYPLEIGAVISDHSIEQPMIIEVDGVISNSYSLPVFGEVPSIVRGNIAQEANRRLEKIIKDKIIVDVQSGLRTYTSMIMIDYFVQRDKRNSDNLKFNAVFKEITVTQTNISNKSSNQYKEGETRSMSAPENNRGRLSTATASDAEIERSLSYISQLKNAA